ncbi:hypothetical protein WJ36_25800 [Burkholderia ubonensis]|uniref:gp53-like domain-containing protein n=1 Tax=Burkholderia ubonensis TaxID=101571 RepID=UPI0007551FA7|nr:hypothetical protein [Burkholderia ubonensis]KVG89112.1 hypothetical protein WJ36_25800 [Burkholderia ubonensis]
MANQPEQDQWDAGVYQIEKTDPVLGGLGGIANAPLLNLANRTKYLYSRIQEILGVGKGYAIAGGTANAITCSYTPAVSAIADGQTFKGKVAAANTGATTFTPNPAAQGGIAPLPVYGLDLQPLSGGEIVGQFAVQYNASLNSGGGAFVLVENPGGIARAIAPAVADNSAAIAPTSWIRSIFAPLASPAFTGSPQAPVPPQFDNSTKLATTAFVQRALGNASSMKLVGAAVAMDVTYAGADVVLYGNSGPYTQVLPPVSTYPSGVGMRFYNASGFPVTIQTAGNDRFSAFSGTVSSIVVGTGDSLVLSAYGPGNWEVMGGSAALPWSSLFGSSLATNGYQKLPSGLIIQWGVVSVPANTTYTYNFPIAYRATCYSLVGTRGAPGSNASFNFSPISVTQFQTQNYGTGTEVASWIALGW